MLSGFWEMPILILAIIMAIILIFAGVRKRDSIMVKMGILCILYGIFIEAILVWFIGNIIMQTVLVLCVNIVAIFIANHVINVSL